LYLQKINILSRKVNLFRYIEQLTVRNRFFYIVMKNHGLDEAAGAYKAFVMLRVMKFVSGLSIMFCGAQNYLRNLAVFPPGVNL